MTSRQLFFRALEVALRPVAAAMSGLLPRALHPGRRACGTLRRVHPLRAIVTRSFAQAVLLSHWRSAVLLRFLQKQSQQEVLTFIRTQVHKEGVPPWKILSSGARPVIVVTPHFGECIAGCLALSHWLKDLRTLAIYYEARRENAGVEPLLRRAGAEVVTLDAGVAGVIRALRTLRKGGYVALMPDMYLDVSATVAIPFLGCWLRVPTGAAYLALKSDALIVPAYAIAMPGLRVVVRFSDPIDPRSLDSGDAAQKRFMLTCLIFADIERTLRKSPEHWRQWELLPKMSTPLDLPDSFSGDDIRSALAARCRAFPALTRYLPELAAPRDPQALG